MCLKVYLIYFKILYIIKLSFTHLYSEFISLLKIPISSNWFFQMSGNDIRQVSVGFLTQTSLKRGTPLKLFYRLFEIS